MPMCLKCKWWHAHSALLPAPPTSHARRASPSAMGNRLALGRAWMGTLGLEESHWTWRRPWAWRRDPGPGGRAASSSEITVPLRDPCPPQAHEWLSQRVMWLLPLKAVNRHPHVSNESFYIWLMKGLHSLLVQIIYKCSTLFFIIDKMILSEPECLQGMSAQICLRTWLETTGFIPINNSCFQGTPPTFLKR